MRVVRQEFDDPCRDLDLIGVAKALFHEGDPLTVWRPRRALAEMCQLPDRGRQVLLRASRPCSLVKPWPRRQREGEKPGTHRRDCSGFGQPCQERTKPARTAEIRRATISGHAPPAAQYPGVLLA